MSNRTEIEIKVIRSNRRTMSLEITPDGEICVRAPLQMSSEKINAFVTDKENWIRQKLNEVETRKERTQAVQPLTQEELNRLGDLALQVLPERVKLYASLMGVTVNRITIRCQKTRWGSCTKEGNLNFNCLLMLAPEAIQDYVVVHELCHRKEMNHSKRFWAEVEKVLPDYRKREKWLKENGGLLMARRPQ